MKEAVAALEVGLEALEDELNAEGQRVPNMTHPDVPRGGEELMVTLRTVSQFAHITYNPHFIRVKSMQESALVKRIVESCFMKGRNVIRLS